MLVTSLHDYMEPNSVNLFHKTYIITSDVFERIPMQYRL